MNGNQKKIQKTIINKINNKQLESGAKPNQTSSRASNAPERRLRPNSSISVGFVEFALKQIVN